MLQATAVGKSFGRVRALDGVSFSLARGQAVALWGPNGAGKTTLMRCALGLFPFTGSVAIGGMDARRQGKEARRLVGFVPQEITFHPHLSVRETMWLYARLKRVADPGRAGRRLLERFGLAGEAEKRVGALSGGMKRRLALAVALLSDPPLLILDEPTADLDTAGREALLSSLSTLRDTGKAILFSSHRPGEVLRLADRIVALKEGRLTADGPATDVAARLGLLPRLRLQVAPGHHEDALAALRAAGADAHRNHEGVVVPSAKGKAHLLKALFDAGVPLTDFSVESGQAES